MTPNTILGLFSTKKKFRGHLRSRDNFRVFKDEFLVSNLLILDDLRRVSNVERVVHLRPMFFGSSMALE